MASVTEVASTLAAMLAGVMYPNGTGQPSIAGVPVLVYPGWPSEAQLDADLLALDQGAGKCHLTVWPTDTEKNTTRYPTDWVTQQAPAVTIAAAIAGQQVTLSGTVSTPQNVVIVANGLPFVYAIQAADTLSSIAAALASLLVVGGIAATSSGAVVTLPAAADLTAARVGANGVMSRELGRQERMFQLSIWAATPTQRDAIGKALDVAMRKAEFVALPDGYAARVVYVRSVETDRFQKEKLYRRDLFYSIEYPTTESTSATSVTQTETVVSVADASPVIIYQ